MRRISFKGIIIGAVVSVVIVTIGVLILATVNINKLAQKGLSNQQITEQLKSHAYDNDMLFIIFVICTIATVLGGYTAARIAKTSIYYNSGLLGIIGIILGLFFIGQNPIWFDALGLLTIVPVSLFGGYLAGLRMKNAI